MNDVLKIRQRNVNIIYFFITIATLMVRIITSFVLQLPAFNDKNDPSGLKSDAVFTMLIQWVFFTAVTISAYLIHKKINKDDTSRWYSDFGFNKFSFTKFLQAFLIFVFSGPLVVVVNLIFYYFVLSPFGYVFPTNDDKIITVQALIASIFLTAISPAIGEEMFNRGLLFSAYKDRGHVFVLRSALLFSLMHQNIRQTGYTFFFGILVGLCMFYSRSIWGGVLIHFLNNGLQVLYQYAGDTGTMPWLLKIRNAFLPGGTVADLAKFSLLVTGCVIGMIGVFVWMRYRAIKTGEYDPKDKNRYYQGEWKNNIPYYVTILIGVSMATLTLVWGSTVL